MSIVYLYYFTSYYNYLLFQEQHRCSVLLFHTWTYFSSSIFNQPYEYIFQSMVGGCAHHQCGKTQRCRPLDNDNHECVNISK